MHVFDTLFVSTLACSLIPLCTFIVWLWYSCPIAAMDDHGTFRSLMNDVGVSSVQTEHIVAQGYTTIALLAHAVPEPDQIEAFVEHISLIPMGEKFEQFSSQTSSLRRLVKECVEKAHGSGRPLPAETPPPTAPKTKLSAAEVRAMKQSFSQSYPGELLTPASTPSASFLTLVKEATDSNTLGWIPAPLNKMTLTTQRQDGLATTASC